MTSFQSACRITDCRTVQQGFYTQRGRGKLNTMERTDWMLSHSLRSFCQYPLSKTKIASLTADCQADTSRISKSAASIELLATPVVVELIRLEDAGVDKVNGKSSLGVFPMMWYWLTVPWYGLKY
jgi:hypothetical protein